MCFDEVQQIIESFGVLGNVLTTHRLAYLVSSKSVYFIRDLKLDSFYNDNREHERFNIRCIYRNL